MMINSPMFLVFAQFLSGGAFFSALIWFVYNYRKSKVPSPQVVKIIASDLFPVPAPEYDLLQGFETLARDLAEKTIEIEYETLELCPCGLTLPKALWRQHHSHHVKNSHRRPKANQSRDYFSEGLSLRHTP